jgi:DNA repair exonuclease SbcCD ATPase subunit
MAKRYSRPEDDEEVVVAEEQQETVEEAQVDSEEETFKKRYGDLRRYMQQTVEAKDKELENLKQELRSQKKEEFKLPTSEEEIEAWASKYPEVAKIVDSIAQKRAREASSEVEQSMQDLRTMKKQLEKEKAEHQLKQMHPDFDNIRQNRQFHDWVAQQPTYIQDALYKNETDAIAAARAIDLYKADMGMIAEKRSDSQLEKDAAKAVSKASKGSPSGNPSVQWSESRVASMTAHEYEKNEEAILEAIQTNKFVYDMSGGAR